MRQNNRNRARALAALDAVRHFSQSPYGEAITGPDVLNQNISDLLANLAHLCDREGFNFPALVDRARNHYRAETGQTGVQL